MRRLALLLLGGLAVLAALAFLNVVRLEVNATLPLASKNLNLSVYLSPLPAGPLRIYTT
jgi:hypothetical protein